MKPRTHIQTRFCHSISAGKFILSPLLLLAPVSVHAQTTWNFGATPDRNWSASSFANWDTILTPEGTAVTFGTAGATANATTVSNIVDADYSISALTYNANSTNWQVTQIESPQTLTVGGAFLVGGLTVNSQNTRVAFTGTGSLVMNNSAAAMTIANTGGTSTKSTLDMSALSTFTATASSFNVGTGTTGFGTVYLADASTITAPSINSGGSNSSYGTAVSNLLYLGTTNTFNADTVALAGNRTLGTVKFRAVGDGAANNTAVSAATLKIRAAGGSLPAANMRVGAWTGGAGSNGGTSTVNLTGGSVDALVTTLKVGSTSSGFNGQTANAILSLGGGTFDATSVIMGETVSNNDNTGTVTGTLNVSGGTLGTDTLKLANNTSGSMGTKGTLNVSGTGAVDVGGDLSMGVRTGTATLTPTLSVSGGILTVSGNLAEGTGAGASIVSTVNLSGGKLVLGNAMTVDTFAFTGGILQLGDDSATGSVATALVIDSGTNAANLTIKRDNAVVQGTDFSGDPIAGALSLTQAGAGTTTLNAANTYSGNTLVSGGVLTLGNNMALQNSAIDTSGAGTIDVTDITAPTFGGLTGSVALDSVITTGYSSVTGITLNPATGVTNTYSGAIANGAMTLTKTGLGTQILSGTNTYTGDTTVTAGTLAVNGSSIFDDNKLVIAGGFVDLTGAETVNTLFFGEVQQPAGTYSATGDEDTIPSSNFTGTGTLIVTSGPGGPVDPYTAWIDSPAYNTPPLTAGQKLPDADPDGDGNPNILEFAINGNPVNGSDNGKIASLIQDSSTPSGNELTLVVAVRDGASFAGGATATISGITYTVEGSLDLAFPSSVVSSTGPSDTAPPATGLPSLEGTAWEYQTFKLDESESLGGKGFLRLKVTQP